MSNQTSFAKLDQLVDTIENELAQLEFGSENAGKSEKIHISHEPDSVATQPVTTDNASDKITDIGDIPDQAEGLLTHAEGLIDSLDAKIWRDLSEQFSDSKSTLDALRHEDFPCSDMSDTKSIQVNEDLPQKESEEQASPLAPPDKLDEIQERIDKYWDKTTPKANSTTRYVSAVMSLGFVVVGVLYSAYILGGELVNRTGQGWWLIVCLILGMFVSFYVGFILLYPLARAGQIKKSGSSEDKP